MQLMPGKVPPEHRELPVSPVPAKDTGNLAQCVLDAVVEQICVLDETGVIAATNSAWKKSRLLDGSLTCGAVVGDDYVQRCSELHHLDATQIEILNHGLERVREGALPSLEFEYSMFDGVVCKWYQGTATRFVEEGNSWVALVHVDITEQKAQTDKILLLSHIRAMLGGVNSLILRVNNRDELFRGACRIVVEDGQFMMSWVGVVEPGDDKLTAIASAGVVGDFISSAPPALFSVAPDSELPVARVIRTRTAIYSNDVANDPQIVVKLQLAARGIKSLALLPLIVQEHAIGVLAIYSAESYAFNADEINALNQLAGDVSFSLEYMEKKDQVAYLIHHDPVTGLPNRRLFSRLLGEDLRQARLENSGLAVLLIDFADFKHVTDALGRAGGDTVLQIIAARLGKCVNRSATVARLEGAEFAIIVPVRVDTAEARLMVEAILSSLAIRFEVGSQELHLTAHIGIAAFPGDGESADTLLANADVAIYSARAEGRHNFRFYTTDMNADARRKIQMEAGLRRAIKHHEFVLHYQPKIDTISGEIVGLEALLRWAPPGGALIPPLEFIPTLEETGLIVEVGEWVLRTACKQISSWRNIGVTPLQIAVNLSARQFQRDGLAEMISRTLREFKVPANCIEMEITESALLHDSAAAVITLDRLRSLGIRVSIDDFGTGYSSLSYLKRLPLDALKIDRTFISDVTENPDDAAITRAIITMSHNLNLKVIAEGVETEQQLAFLRTNHCDEVQGYLFSKPLPADEITKFISVGSGLHVPVFKDVDRAVPTLLLVDDDKSFRLLLKELFATDGYSVLTAAAPRQAFDLLALHDVDMIISDQNMPGMQGVEFLKRVRRMYPGIVRIMMTGQNDAETVTAAVNDGEVFKFFAKQHDEDLLHTEVARLFHQMARSLMPN